jgi:DNA-binding CsgD family transcriptional regulator
VTSPAERPAALLSPLTLSERVAVGEDFFLRYYSVTLYATVLLAAIAVILALLNPRAPATGTLVVAALICLAVRAGLRPNGYGWLRRHRYAIVLAGPLTALSSLWSTVDANAVYFPALAPLALIAGLAQRRRERVAVIVSVALGTLVAALLDTGSPELSTPNELAGATIGVAIVGLLLGVVVDWCARKVLLAPEDLEPDAQEAAAVVPPPQVAERGRRLARVSAISRASNEELESRRSPLLASLTAREVQILFLIAERLDRYDIADRLSISPKTVDKHVQHVREKTELTGSGRPTSWLTLHLPPFESAHPEPPRPSG